MSMSEKDARLSIAYVDPQQLVPFVGNPRTISEIGLEKLQRSVEEFGFINPILVQSGTNMIIAGHQRLKAAQLAGLNSVPVIYLSMGDKEAKAYNVADNRLAEESDWAEAELALLLKELDSAQLDLSLTGFGDKELKKMLGEVSEQQAPLEFEEFGGDVSIDYCCPRCGYGWSGRARQ